MTVTTVDQVDFEVDRPFKIELLPRLIDIHGLKLGIIFYGTKRSVDDRVDHFEAAGYMAERLHVGITQNSCDRVMAKFRRCGLEFLVVPDSAPSVSFAITCGASTADWQGAKNSYRGRS